MSRSDLEILMTTLEVDVVRLTECLVSPGWRLSFPASDLPAIHYNLAGTGQMVVGAAPAIPLAPHTLVIAPPRLPVRIDVTIDQGMPSALRVVEARSQSGDPPGTVQTFVAGDNEPMVMLICGYFRASYGMSIDLFAKLPSPIVERFETADDLEHKLKSALVEISAQQVGMRAMTTALLKQVLVTLLRRSLSSTDLWLERFAMLSDPQIARAFVDMVARPGAPHSVLTLSETAGLSRSAFMARFAGAFASSPMVVLRQLRMRRAANMLAANILSIEQIAHAVGYTSRSSFFRAFRQIYGHDPSDYRAAARRSPDKWLGKREQFRRDLHRPYPIPDLVHVGSDARQIVDPRVHGGKEPRP
jgi:AraC family transcriptional activator of mtrCDE